MYQVKWLQKFQTKDTVICWVIVILEKEYVSKY